MSLSRVWVRDSSFVSVREGTGRRKHRERWPEPRAGQGPAGSLLAVNCRCVAGTFWGIPLSVHSRKKQPEGKHMQAPHKSFFPLQKSANVQPVSNDTCGHLTPPAGVEPPGETLGLPPRHSPRPHLLKLGLLASPSTYRGDAKPFTFATTHMLEKYSSL